MARLNHLVLPLLLLLLAACSSEEPTTAPQESSLPPSPSSYIEQGDLDAIAGHGRLRVLALVEPEEASYLPRRGAMENQERELLRRFAKERSLQFELVPVDAYPELLPTLIAGRGDIVADNMTITAERRKQATFTAPVAYVREQLLMRRGDTVNKPHDLAGRRVAVHRSASFYNTLTSLQKRRFQPEFTIEEVPESVPLAAIVEGVASGQYDLTVVDSNLATNLLSYRDDISVGFDVSGINSIGWAVRPNAKELLAHLNDFINRYHLGERDSPRFSGDLNAIRERGVVRVLTRNNAANYFLWRGELLGFEYEMMQRFAEQLGVRLEMIVPPEHADLIAWLKAGRGDLIAASFTITPEREKAGIRFTLPYNSVTELVVGRSNEKVPPTGPTQLAGRSIAVRPSSSYAESLSQLREKGIDIKMEAVAESMETEEIIAAVADGKYDLTLADSHILDIELTTRDDVESLFALEGKREHGWAVRDNNPKLLKALNAFIEKEYRGLFYNITYNKYFRDSKKIVRHAEERIDRDEAGRFSPYDKQVKRYARKYGFDWRLIVSQMYQESRFDPAAKSWMGALGLMQVLPKTAKALKINGELRNPEVGIHAGVKYLNWLMQRFETDLDIGERTWFALAAYNAGIGHVRDARKLAREKGWDGDRWFDNVERAIVLLSKKEYASKAKYGYAHGRETRAYVRGIRDRYRAYLDLTES